MFFNTHSHVDTSRQFQQDRDEVVARAARNGRFADHRDRL